MQRRYYEKGFIFSTTSEDKHHISSNVGPSIRVQLLAGAQDSACYRCFIDKSAVTNSQFVLWQCGIMEVVVQVSL